MSLYKIECFSSTGVNVVTEVIGKAGGRCVVEGLAVVTDHCFNDEQTHEVINCVSTTTEVNATDVQVFNEATGANYDDTQVQP